MPKSLTCPVCNSVFEQVTKPIVLGRPVGPFGLLRWAEYRDGFGPAPFTLSVSDTNQTAIIKQLQLARDKKIKVMTQMTGGSHQKFMTNGRFDRAKWSAALALYNTPAIKDAVKAAHADGTWDSENLMDEPHHRDWVIMTKAMIDSMASEWKDIFGDLPTCVTNQWDWRREEKYTILDFLLCQYSKRKGPVETYRDNAIAETKKQGMKVAFSINILNGGHQVANCPEPETGGIGVNEGDNLGCRVTPLQLKEWGIALLSTPDTHGLTFWRYDTAFFQRQPNVAAVEEIVKIANGLPTVNPLRGK